VTAFRFFLPENTAQGVTGTSLAGISDADNGALIEKGITLPWVQAANVSWLDYKIWIEVHLDSGMVVHKPLPQTYQTVDTLAAVLADPNFSANGSASVAALSKTPIDQFNTAGVNIQSKGKYTDFLQRMATSDYRFVLKGYGLRAGYQVPVPGIVSVGGIPAIPEKQWSLGNRLEGNFSGVPVFFNQWELWYLVTVPPVKNQLPPPNVAEHIRADVELPTGGMQVPYSWPDMNAVQTLPPPTIPPIGPTRG
jgi:hypothetical protein